MPSAFLGAAGLVAGVYLAVGEYRLARDFPRTFSWPTVAGEVVTGAELRETKRSYSLHASYTYYARGRRYRSTDLWLHGSTGDREYLLAYVPLLEAGRSIDVRYDPADPSRSVVFPGSGDRRPWDFTHLFMIVVTVALGSTLLWRACFPSTTPRRRQ